ncbi:MAG: DUF6064 family protein [Ramlibacter sp.]
MSEWWTYSLSDFLMFSPAVYARMVERYHREMGPLPWVLLAVGLVLVAAAATRKPWAHRAVLLTLAALWAWVGWAFHWQRYAQINWAAQYLAWGWGLQAGLLAGVALAVTAPVPPPSRGGRLGGPALAAAGLLLHALHAQAFGLMPGPTALATLGLLWMLQLRWRAALCAMPVLALLTEGLTGWMLHGNARMILCIW